MARRQRVDSVKGMVELMNNAAKGPPEMQSHIRIRDKDKPFLVAFRRVRADDELAGADIAMAAELARCQADIEAEQPILDTEETVLTNRMGSVIANPRCGIIDVLIKREAALVRSLRMAGVN